MNDLNSIAPGGRFPTFRRSLGWLFGWRTIRRCLFVLVCLITLLALFYAEENWRGRHAWNQYRLELEAKGALLDYGAYIPKSIPDEQNFATTPFVQSWFVMVPGKERWSSKDNYFRASTLVKSSKDAGNRRLLDLHAWSLAFDEVQAGKRDANKPVEAGKLDLESRTQAVPVILAHLKDDESSLAELRAASRRPHSRYPVNYDLDNPWGTLIPHLASINSVCLRLQLRACSELVGGRSDNALEDVNLMLYLADSLKEDPFVISYLVRLACLQFAIQPVWEGLAGHLWSDAQLQELQSRFQQYELLVDMQRPLGVERAAGILTADLLYRKKYLLSELSGSTDGTGGGLADLVVRFAPHGWYSEEKVNICRLYQTELEGTFDAAARRISPGRIAANAHELERKFAGGHLGRGFNAIIHHQVLATLLLPSLSKTPMKAAMAQTVADQAALACALERYRLANGQYPDKLDAIAPQLVARIPNDVISGEPLKYHPTDDGQFVLYSVGWNEKDDGGAPGKALFDEKEGDWVWR